VTNRIDFALVIQVPDVLATIGNLVTQRLAQCGAHIIEASGKHYDISIKFGAVSQHQTVFFEAADTTGTLVDFDLAVYDELARSYVDVVTTSACDVFAVDTRFIITKVEFETRLDQSWFLRLVLLAS
jgi:hypothetical protein